MTFVRSIQQAKTWYDLTLQTDSDKWSPTLGLDVLLSDQVQHLQEHIRQPRLQRVPHQTLKLGWQFVQIATPDLSCSAQAVLHPQGLLPSHGRHRLTNAVHNAAHQTAFGVLGQRAASLSALLRPSSSSAFSSLTSSQPWWLDYLPEKFPNARCSHPWSQSALQLCWKRRLRQSVEISSAESDLVSGHAPTAASQYPICTHSLHRPYPQWK